MYFVLAPSPFLLLHIFPYSSYRLLSLFIFCWIHRSLTIVRKMSSSRRTHILSCYF